MRGPDADPLPDQVLALVCYPLGRGVQAPSPVQVQGAAVIEVVQRALIRPFVWLALRCARRDLADVYWRVAWPVVTWLEGCRGRRP